LEKKTKDELLKCLKSKGKEKLFERYWGIIATKIILNANEREGIELLEIAVKFRKRGKIDRKIDNLLERHTKKFCWSPHYEFYLPIWNKEYFKKRLKEIKNPKGTLEKLRLEREKQQEELKKVKEELKDNKKLVQLINLTQEYLYLRAYRTEVLREAFYYLGTPLLKEIAKRMKFKNWKDIIYLTPDETGRFLINKVVPNLKEIKRRKQHWAMVTREGKTKIISDEKEIAKIKEELELQEEIEEVMKGNTAYPGLVNGKVRLIRTIKDVKKLQKGEILVAAMTTPDMTVAIHKAAAIVTDEGGLTCHAAICSRELKIPCVIATKNATKVLKDGDLIEVDANTGIVKILEKAK